MVSMRVKRRGGFPESLCRMPDLIGIITSADPGIRNQSLEKACAGLSVEALLTEAAALDRFRRRSRNLYEQVRALFFLYIIHRFHLPRRFQTASRIGDQANRFRASRL